MTADFLHSTPSTASGEDNRTEAEKNNDLADELFGSSLLNNSDSATEQTQKTNRQEQTGEGPRNKLANEAGGTILTQAQNSPVAQGADYEFDLPPNFNADEGLMQEFKDLAAEHGLSQGAAQSLLNLQVKSNEYLVQQMQAQRQNWVQELRNDHSYGGRNFGETVQDALKTLRAFDPEAKISNLLEQSGFGDNPDVIRFLADIARAHLKEDKLLTARGGRAQEGLSLADRLWPDD